MKYIFISGNTVKHTLPGGNGVYVSAASEKVYIHGNYWLLGADPVYIKKHGEEIDYYIAATGDTVRTNVEISR